MKKRKILISIAILVLLIIFYFGMSHRSMKCMHLPNILGISDEGFNLFSKVSVSIYSTHEFTEKEFSKIETFGGQVNRDTWIGPLEDYLFGFYMAEIRVYDACRIQNLNFVQKVNYLGGKSFTI